MITDIDWTIQMAALKWIASVTEGLASEYEKK